MTTQAQIDKLKADAAQMRADVNAIVPTAPVYSPDDTLMPPATSIATPTGVLTLGPPAGDGRKFVVLDGKPTNGHASSVWWHKAIVYAKSPTTPNHWWKMLGSASWKDMGTVDPGTL